MEKQVVKKEKAVPKKVYNIGIKFYPDGTAMVMRKNLPSIIDKTTNLVKWLRDCGCKEEDIEIVGDKPDCWGDFFPTILDNPMSTTTLTEEVKEVLNK